MRDVVLENIRHIRELDTRAYTLYNKYFECIETFKMFGDELIADVYSNMMSFDDLEVFMRNEENDIKIVHVDDDTDQMNRWMITRRLVHSMTWEQNMGRNMKFLMYINGKIAAVVSLASDMMSLKKRDEYIGWSKDDKLFGKKRLNCTAACSTIMPVQPLGYMAAGGKLVSLLLYHTSIREAWEKAYGDTMAGLTTTSLYGNTSQYSGMNKYWKSCDTTAGTTPLLPQKDVYKQMIEWLKQNHLDEYKAIFEEQVNAKGEVYMKSTPKYHVINLFYKKTDFKNYLRENDINPDDLFLQHQRGVYFARFYDNTNEFLSNVEGVTEDKLTPRQLDFDVKDANSIVKYWKRKWATRRFEKKLQEPTYVRSKFMMHLKGIDSSDSFIAKYHDYDATQENLDEVFASVWNNLFTWE